jgi:hypothetical protein
MIEIIAVAVVGVLGFFSGWKAREETAVRRMNEILGEVQASDDDFPDVIKIVIEKYNNVYYVYDLENKFFMAQGNTRKELERVLAEKYPGKTFAASSSNLSEMGFV